MSAMHVIEKQIQNANRNMYDKLLGDILKVKV